MAENCGFKGGIVGLSFWCRIYRKNSYKTLFGGSMLEVTANRRGLCFIIAAPSGAGKSTITRAMLTNEPDLTLSISVTTRDPRPGERDGVDYHFVSQSRFDRMAEDGALLEHATVFGRSYGTPREPVEAALSDGRDVVFDVDWQGWRLIRAALPSDTVGVFILPPSLSALAERLARRATDRSEVVAQRMRAALDEISHWREFDHVLVNDDLDRCVALVRSILHAARCTTARSVGVGEFVAGLTLE